MFRCGICGGVSQSREKATHAVLERRAITQADTGKPGMAIAREVLAHDECARMESIAQGVTMHVPDLKPGTFQIETGSAVNHSLQPTHWRPGAWVRGKEIEL